MLNEDFRDMLQCLLDANVEFLVIGGYALAAHGFPRATKDIDIWIWASPENAERVLTALQRFGAPMNQITEDDFAMPGVVFQIGVPPRRIDITTVVDGVEFSACYTERVLVDVDGLQVPVLSKEDLVATKRASGRPQDLLDADTLEGRA